jgi:hypothetical protein
LYLCDYELISVISGSNDSATISSSSGNNNNTANIDTFDSHSNNNNDDDNNDDDAAESSSRRKRALPSQRSVIEMINQFYLIVSIFFSGQSTSDSGTIEAKRMRGSPLEQVSTSGDDQTTTTAMSQQRRESEFVEGWIVGGN